ncbi:MAG TPA: tetratricopeptide repeat protein [Pirellulales bacterium]|jgi:tetratricopeptide (TPR) repeat protein
MWRLMIFMSIVSAVVVWPHSASAEERAEEGDQRCLVRVGDEKIVMADVLPSVNKYISDLKADYPELSEDELTARRDKAVTQKVEHLIKVKLLLLDARQKIGSQKMAEIRKKFADYFEEKELPKALSEHNQSREEFESQLRKIGCSLELEKKEYVEAQITTGWLLIQVDSAEHPFGKEQATLDYVKQLRNTYPVEMGETFQPDTLPDLLSKNATPLTAIAAKPAKIEAPPIELEAQPKKEKIRNKLLGADAKAGWRGVKVLPKENCKVLAVGGKEIARTEISLPYVVQDVNGQWLWVGDHKKGWVLRSQVLTLGEASAYYNDWIGRDPRCTKAYELRAVASRERREWDLAMADVEVTLRLEPGASAFINRGRIWLKKKEVDKAFSDFDEAVRLDPKYAAAYINRGSVWQLKGEFEKAIADYNESIRLDPELVGAYLGRGICWYQKNEYAKAIADLNQALRLDPNDPATYAVVALLRSNCHDARFLDRAKAVRLATRSCELTGWRNSVEIEGLAVAYWANGEYEHAIQSVQKALELKSDRDVYLNNLKRQLERQLAKKQERLKNN